MKLYNPANKRKFSEILSILLIAILHLSFTILDEMPANPEPGKPGKPNIILIVADDLGYADISLNGSTQIPTPHIDRLAAEGVNFTRGYVSAPVCAPSRAGFLTGRNQVRFGFDNNIAANQPGFDPEFLGLPVSELTIADRLRSLGYVTGLVGKWHLGFEPHFHPLKRGFDEFWGYQGGAHDYFTADIPGGGSSIESNYKTPQRITYLTDDKGDECIGFIRRHREEPFFLFASFNAPHLPMQALEKDIKLFSHIKDLQRRIYCAMVYRLDLNVGRIMKALEDEGLAENTLVAFISDNGGPCDQNSAVNAPLNGQKGILLEGGIRVPFIIRWPAGIPAGSTYDHPVISLDFVPTFVEIAGGSVLPSDGFDGVNLVSYLTGENREKPHGSFTWKFTISGAIAEGEWKLVRLPDRLPMLYNLNEDISEQHNVASQYPERTAGMLKKLGEWDVSLPHPLFLEGAEWKKKQLDLYDREYPLTQPPVTSSPY